MMTRGGYRGGGSLWTGADFGSGETPSPTWRRQAASFYADVQGRQNALGLMLQRQEKLRIAILRVPDKCSKNLRHEFDFLSVLLNDPVSNDQAIKKYLREGLPKESSHS